MTSRSDAGERTAAEVARDALAQAREALAAAERAVTEVEGQGCDHDHEAGQKAPEPTWMERLWAAPSEARIGVSELTEALGVSESWIYQRTRADADPRLPHGKIGGSLTFRVGEVRAWIRDHEETVEAYRSEPAKGELREVS